MTFLITAYDFTDKDALARRMAVRPRHLQNINRVLESNQILCAGGITNDEGKPIGSFLIMDFPSREDLDKYLEVEPYIIEKVWKKVKVETCNAVIVDNKIRK